MAGTDGAPHWASRAHAEPANTRDEPSPSVTLPKLQPFDATALLARVWAENLPTMRARVDMLEQAAAEAAAGSLSPPTRANAGDVAHKLAGSLGMFGFPRGTEIAREIETMLEGDVAPDAAALAHLAADLRGLLPL